MHNNGNKKRIKWYLFGLIICIATVAVFFIRSDISKAKTNINSARRLTDDHLRHSPIEFRNEVYFPSSFNFPDHNNTGYLAKIQTKDNSFLVSLINQDQVIADMTDEKYTHLKTGGGDDSTRFTKASFIENPDYTNECINKYSKFVLCNDEASKDIRIALDKETLLELENMYGQITYNAEDFNKYDNLYYIFVDSPISSISSLKGEVKSVIDNPIIYLGCIFVVQDKLYYGNLNNNITGELADKLKNIIGL